MPAPPIVLAQVIVILRKGAITLHQPAGHAPIAFGQCPLEAADHRGGIRPDAHIEHLAFILQRDLDAAARKIARPVVDDPHVGGQHVAGRVAPQRIIQAHQQRIGDFFQPFVGQLGHAVIIHEGPVNARPGRVQLPDQETGRGVLAAARMLHGDLNPARLGALAGAHKFAQRVRRLIGRGVMLQLDHLRAVILPAWAGRPQLIRRDKAPQAVHRGRSLQAKLAHHLSQVLLIFFGRAIVVPDAPVVALAVGRRDGLERARAVFSQRSAAHRLDDRAN